MVSHLPHEPEEMHMSTEELVLANAELRRALRLKDEFLANLSHELRTPLTAILGLSEALQLGFGGKLTQEQGDMLAALHGSGQHLLNLLSDVLDLSKIAAGQFTLELSLLDVAECCDSALRIIRELAMKKGIRIEQKLDPAVDSIRADARRMKQMLINLLGNAIKFTPEGGTIGVLVRGKSVQHLVELTVWDTGIGIAPEDQARLFTPFVQVHLRPSRDHEGTGLGLSLVRQMAELHGGGVTVESALGRGSRFTITLPWRETDRADARAQPGGALQDTPLATRAIPGEQERRLEDMMAENWSKPFIYTKLVESIQALLSEQ